MCISELTEVAARLEQSVLLTKEHEDQEINLMYERYEMLAIQILDSESDNFPNKALEFYLIGYLQATKYSLLGENAYLIVHR